MNILNYYLRNDLIMHYYLCERTTSNKIIKLYQGIYTLGIYNNELFLKFNYTTVYYRCMIIS